MVIRGDLNGMLKGMFKLLGAETTSKAQVVTSRNFMRRGAALWVVEM